MRPIAKWLVAAVPTGTPVMISGWQFAGSGCFDNVAWFFHVTKVYFLV